MGDDLISRKALINALFVRNGKMCPDTDIDNFPITINVKDVKKAIRDVPASYDVDKVVEKITELQLRVQDKFYNVEDEEYAVMLRGQLRGIADCLEIIKSVGVADE